MQEGMESGAEKCGIVVVPVYPRTLKTSVGKRLSG